MVSGNKYALPGGFLDRDETASQAVLREVKEETGYQAKIVNLLTVIDNPHRKGEDRQNVSFVFMVEPKNKTGGYDHEVTRIKWFDLNHLPSPEEVAFDHYQIIKFYLNVDRENLKIPIFNT